jgi:WD40 repeat protein
MPLPLGSESGRRLLIAAGTAHFKELSDSDLPRVPDELECIAKSFAALGYERQQAALSFNPESGQLRALFADARKESRAEDLVVAYYTGHGARDAERFYLLARNSDPSDLDGTALPAEDLARALTKDSKASQVLVILDACYAGAGAGEFAQVANRLAAVLGGGPAVFIIAAARPKQEAEQGALSSALATALANNDARLGGCAQAFLAMDDVMETVDSYLRQTHQAQTATWSSANVRGRCRLFPNPLHRPEVRPGLDLETQRAFTEHWVPKARGAELGAGGWYFTGRQQALRELAAWLSAKRSDGRARVVTGGPGSGKSAVLARLVTLADPTYRKEVLAATRPATLDPATLPPEGVVSVAVHARHKLIAEATAQIAAGLGLAARDPAELLAALAQRPEKTVIVVDALDEADNKDEIVSRLLRPLAELPQIFLLVGTRPDSSEHGRRFRALGEAVVEIDLDHPRYVGADDVASYVERRLLAAEEPGRLTPYRDSPETTRTVARAVAERANSVFLVAHTAVHALLAATSIVDVTQTGWVEGLPTGLDDAFTRFLAELDTRRPGGLSSTKARAVLVPLAFAEGEGLPWLDLWAATATALSGSDISDADVTLVRQHASAFIVEAVEQDRSVYRLYHERLAEQLRGSVANAKEAQQRIIEALRSRVPRARNARGPDWTRAHPYVLAHLATHAFKARTLGELVMDGTFLAAADPLRTLQALSVSNDPQAQRAYACYSLAFDRLREQPTDVRLSYLEMTARQEGDDALAEIWRGAGVPRCWTVPWARWQPVAAHRTILAETGASSVALGMLEGRPVIVSSGYDGAVRVWDLASGTQRGEPLRGHEGPVWSVTLGTLEGLPVIVSGGSDGTVRVWDLASGLRRGEPLRGHEAAVLSVALGTLHGRPVIVSGAWDATVRVWDLASARQRGEPLRHEGWVFSVVVGMLEGRPVIVSGVVTGASERTVEVWDLASGTRRGDPLRGHERGVNSVALGTLDGKPVIVSGGEDSTLRVWDLASGMQRGESLRGHESPVKSVALGALDGRPVIVSGGEDSTLRVWDLASGTPRGEPLRGHESPVKSVALGTLDGRPVIVSGSSDRTVRVWDLASGTLPREPLRGHDDSVTSVALGSVDGRPVIVSGGYDFTARVWDLASGMPLREPPCRHERVVMSVALGTLEGRPVIVSGGYDYLVRVWDFASGTQRAEPLRGHKAPVMAVALGMLGGRPVIVSGGQDSTIRVWDLASGNQLGEPLNGHEGYVTSVALGTLDGRPVIVSGGYDFTVRVWDLVSGRQRGEPMGGHEGGHEDWVHSVALGMVERRPVIVSGGDDKTVRLWDLVSGLQRGEPLRGHESGVSSVALGTLDGRPVILSGGHDATVRVWDTGGGAVSSVRIGSDVTAVAFANPGTLVVAAKRGLLVLQFATEAILRAEHPV